MKPLLCIFHSPCGDGFGSAWVVNRFCKQVGIPVEFHPGIYQKPPPDVTDRHVLMVDFSYKMDVLAEMHHQALSLLVLDHHKTARDDLGVLLPAPLLTEMVERWADDQSYYSAHALFDMERSGAGITWDYFYPGKPRPRLIDHIEDRDLWRFKIPGTREINACVFSYPYEFDVWNNLVDQCESKHGGATDLVMQGAAIERKHHKDIGELLEIVTRPMRFRVGPPHDEAPNTVVVPAANLPYTLTSDAGHLLCERGLRGQKSRAVGVHSLSFSNPFAVCYWDTPDGRQFSLRSRDDGMDVGEIAKLYSGGGHPHAAGFRVSFDQLAQFEP